jgi:hypothetical protein
MTLKNIQYPEKGGVYGGIVGICLSIITPIAYILYRAFTSTWVLGIYGTLYSAKILFLSILCIILPITFVTGYIIGISHKKTLNIKTKYNENPELNLKEQVILKEIFPKMKNKIIKNTIKTKTNTNSKVKKKKK